MSSYILDSIFSIIPFRMGPSTLDFIISNHLLWDEPVYFGLNIFNHPFWDELVYFGLNNFKSALVG